MLSLKSVFISHYVHIKLSDYRICVIKRNYLYIPLRSYKTKPRLITTAHVKTFISHYVHIKQVAARPVRLDEHLYIPLRSYKTCGVAAV